MEERSQRRPVKVKVSDKRRQKERAETPAKSPEAGPDASELETVPEPSEGLPPSSPEKEHDYLDDLRRVQAEFDNYRKRVLREQTDLTRRASARLVEKLLPVLDNFDSARAHGEGGNGLEILHRELQKVLQDEGLEEIDAQGKPFDPALHEAFEAVEDDSVDRAMCRSVLRRGYRLGGQVLRPAMVSVARPPEEEQESDQDVAEA